MIDKDTFLIGFVGYKNSGKTSVAKAFGEHFHDGVHLCGFSNPLYSMLEAGFGITYEDIQDKAARDIPLPQLGGRSIQYALNTLGTDWGRHMMNEDLWADAAIRTVKPGRVNIFDNVRFPNEFDKIKNAGGMLVHISNPSMSDDGTAPEAWVGYLGAKCDYSVFNEQGTVSLSDVTEVLFEQFLEFFDSRFTVDESCGMI